MSRFQFQTPTLEEAVELLAWRRREEMFQGDLYNDAIACVHRTWNVATPFEVATSYEYNRRRAPSGFPCGSCGRFVFPVAGVRCFWCRR